MLCAMLCTDPFSASHCRSPPPPLINPRPLTLLATAAQHQHCQPMAHCSCREDLQAAFAQHQNATELHKELQSWVKQLGWPSYVRTASMAQSNEPALLDQLRVYIASTPEHDQANPLLRSFLAKTHRQQCPWDGFACFRSALHQLQNGKQPLVVSQSCCYKPTQRT